MRLIKFAPAALALASAGCADLAPTAAPEPAPVSAPSLALSTTVGVDLGTLGDDVDALAVDIDASGRAVGYSTWPFGRAMVFGPAGITLLPGVTREHDAQAFGISPSGRFIVGWVYVPFEGWRPARWKDGGAPELLPTFGPGLFGDVRDVNDAGQVVGSLQSAAGPWRAVRWEADGSITEIPSLGVSGERQAYGINARGDVVGEEGTQPFRYTDADGLTRLGPIAGQTSAMQAGYPMDINDDGVVAGTIWLFIDEEWGPRPVVWSAAGTPSFIGDLADGMGSASAINGKGVVVGGLTSPGASEGHAWVWRPGEARVTRLAVSPTLHEHVYAAGINDAGQIVGRGCCAPGGRALMWSLVAPNATPVIKTVKLTFPTLNRPRAGQSLPLSFVWSDADRSGGPWSWRLEWGDGSTTTGSATTQNEVGAAHAYATAGPRTARFTITDAGGASATKTIPVEVQP